jgi:hypothetical protein
MLLQYATTSPRQATMNNQAFLLSNENLLKIPNLPPPGHTNTFNNIIPVLKVELCSSSSE